MKKILLSLVALCCAMTAGAQAVLPQTATLQVGDETTVFTGASALTQAVAAAPVTGEGIITLSEGTFNDLALTKPVTIYGSGYENLPDRDIRDTYVPNITINLPAEITSSRNIKIVGLRFYRIYMDTSLDNLEVTKCNMYEIMSRNNAVAKVVVTQCSGCTGFSGMHDLLVQNSIGAFSNVSVLNNESTILINHCIKTGGNYGSSNRYTCTNCIIGTSTGWMNLNVQEYHYCIFTNTDNINTSLTSDNNWFNTDEDTKPANLFTDATDLNYTNTRTFTLKKPEKFVGNDGTPVGVNGAGREWTIIPEIPVTKDLQVTVDGKNLNVTYETEVR